MVCLYEDGLFYEMVLFYENGLFLDWIYNELGFGSLAGHGIQDQKRGIRSGQAAQGDNGE